MQVYILFLLSLLEAKHNRVIYDSNLGVPTLKKNQCTLKTFLLCAVQ